MAFRLKAKALERQQPPPTRVGETAAEALRSDGGGWGGGSLTDVTPVAAAAAALFTWPARVYLPYVCSLPRCLDGKLSARRKENTAVFVKAAGRAWTRRQAKQPTVVRSETVRREVKKSPAVLLENALP